MSNPHNVSASYKRWAKKMNDLPLPPYLERVDGKIVQRKADAPLRATPNLYQTQRALALAALPTRSQAQRQADAPLRPTVAQQPRHELGGLFGDEHKQIDLIHAIADVIRKGPKP